MFQIKMFDITGELTTVHANVESQTLDDFLRLWDGDEGEHFQVRNQFGEIVAEGDELGHTDYREIDRGLQSIQALMGGVSPRRSVLDSVNEQLSEMGFPTC